MFQFILKILHSSPLKFFLKIIASLASALIVISGCLAIIDQSSGRKKECEADNDDEKTDEVNDIIDER
jgi:hypothetical protein